MVRDINGLTNNNPAINKPGGQRPNGADQAAGKPQQAAQPAAASRDVVNLSGSAQVLRAASEKLARLPDVNEKRVAEIRDALASGQYSIDAMIVAEKLLGVDGLFD
ncbi:MAG: flagellar biosynthesis anti-sigma factor FlgM [Spongiibacteraceae bacterium]|jgi:negative regulator of flagellin synthesis FlgM|nr:flagellar biosynthesis anti-sigma factor FlgM [Spongiibacteraceae bacterium]